MNKINIVQGRLQVERGRNMTFCIGFKWYGGPVLLGLRMRRVVAQTTNDPWGELTRLSFDERCRSER
jgi:hypothetical protein